MRFLYDDEMLYVGAMLYDDEPDRLIIDSLRRDFSNFQSDSFLLVFDTFLDRRNGYGFNTNAGGAQRDVQSSDNGRRNDANWNGAWFTRSKVLENGWSTEIAVPFKTLRFPPSDVQEWGLHIQRIIRPQERIRHLVAGAAPVLALLGQLRRPADRYHAAFRAGSDLRITPFTTGQFTTGRAGTQGWDRDGDAGVDLKWGVTSSLLLDASYRTDFSQVEADEQQINLTRFSLFFPEKRQFFLESPASFQVGLGAVEAQRRDLVPFFTRRIGLSSSGQPIPVIGGLRLTGRAGGNGIGLLSMQTDEFDGEPGANFTAARVRRDLNGATSVGGFYFGRETTGSRSFNRVTGVDLRLVPTAGAGDRSVRDAQRDRRRAGRLGRAHQLRARYERPSRAHGPRPRRRRLPPRSRVRPPARHRYAVRRLRAPLPAGQYRRARARAQPRRRIRCDQRRPLRSVADARRQG